jgi:hypothetical protein
VEIVHNSYCRSSKVRKSFFFIISLILLSNIKCGCNLSFQNSIPRPTPPSSTLFFLKKIIAFWTILEQFLVKNSMIDLMILPPTIKSLFLSWRLKARRSKRLKQRYFLFWQTRSKLSRFLAWRAQLKAEMFAHFALIGARYYKFKMYEKILEAWKEWIRIRGVKNALKLTASIRGI